MNKQVPNFVKISLVLVFVLTSSVSTVLGSSQLEPNANFQTGTNLPTGGNEINAVTSTESTHPILSEKQVRQAIAYCTDRRALAQAAFPTLTEPEIDALMVDTFLVKTHWAYHEPTTQYPFDSDQGMLLLENAGWTLPEGETYRVNPSGDPLVLKLSTTDHTLRLEWASLFEQQMQDCGIWVVRLHVPSTWLFGSKTGIFRRDYELSGYTNAANLDEPEVNRHFGCNYIPSAQNNWQGWNLTGWCNPTASQAADTAADTQLTQVERLPYFATLQEEYAKDVPALPLFMREDGEGIERIDFNFDTAPLPHPTLNERTVRRAIAYCTDQHALAQAAYPELTTPEIDALMIDSFLTTDHWAYTSPSAQYPYDPDQGRALLDTIGWTIPISETYRENADGDRLALKLSTTQVDMRYAWAEAFEGQMANCGIQVVRFHVDPVWLFGDKTGIFHRDFELGGWTWPADDTLDIVSRFGCDQIPSEENNWETGANIVGWCNETASQAAEIAANTELDQPTRLAAFATLQNEFANDMPSLPLFVRSGSTSIEFLEINMIPVDTTISAVITPEEGGTLTSTFNLTTTLRFPPSAVTEPVTITHQITETHTISSSFQFVGQNFSIQAFSAGGTPVTSFTEPFTLTIQYSDTDVFGLDEASLTLNYWNPETGNWVVIPATLDVDTNTIVAVLDHLTDFAVIGESQNRIYLPAIMLNN